MIELLRDFALHYGVTIVVSILFAYGMAEPVVWFLDLFDE